EGELEDRERSDDAEHEVEEDGRREQRDRDVAEASPEAGAVDVRCLVELVRDALQPGDEDDHPAAADGAPERDYQQRWHRPLDGLQPARAWEAQRPEEEVQDAEVGLEDPAPD